MNNKYKELAHEATLWCEQHAVGTPVAWEWEAKYAELIVQECTDQLSSLMNHEFNESAELETLIAARAVIRKHFGIS